MNTTDTDAWNADHAVDTHTSVHLREQAQLARTVRHRDDGTPYVVLKIQGAHANVDIFIDSEYLLHRLAAEVQHALDTLITRLHAHDGIGGEST